MAKNNIDTAAKAIDTADFVNPFSPGVNYEQFMAAIPSGTSIREYCLNGGVPEEYVTWLEGDIKIYQDSLKNK